MVILYFILSLFIYNQETRYVIENSTIHFYSYAPLEDIQGINSQALGALVKETGEYLIKIPMSSFEFPNKLMQKHFNDSYLETDKYPECIFKGTLDGDTAKGEITLHGVTKKIQIPASINEDGDRITIQSEFKILLQEFKIKIPRLLFKNIAEEIEVKVSSSFTKYKRE